MAISSGSVGGDFESATRAEKSRVVDTVDGTPSTGGVDSAAAGAQASRDEAATDWETPGCRKEVQLAAARSVSPQQAGQSGLRRGRRGSIRFSTSSERGSS